MPIDPTDTDLTLRQFVVGVQRRFADMPGLRDTLTASAWRDDMPFIRDGLAIQLRGKVLAEELPPQVFNHIFDLNKVVTDPRWATWWDHAKATYRNRWWARAWVRRHPPRTVNTQIRVIDRYIIPVTVAARWTYPYASIVPPELGYSILKTDTFSDLVKWDARRDRP